MPASVQLAGIFYFQPWWRFAKTLSPQNGSGLCVANSHTSRGQIPEGLGPQNWSQKHKLQKHACVKQIHKLGGARGQTKAPALGPDFLFYFLHLNLLHHLNLYLYSYL